MNCLANTSSEDDIILLFHQGDERALTFIFNRYHIGLTYFALQLLQFSPVCDPQSAAQDIVAENFIKLWQKRTDFAHLATVKTFLYITTRNACINQLRQSNRRAVSHEEIQYLAEETEDFDAELFLVRTELLQTIWHDVEQLPPVRRQIFKMIYKDGLDSDEIAKALKISVDTVRVQKARALNAIRAAVKEKT